ncbi:hypothetical protein TcCL_Unassigned05369, partial [Trypanosoma cruzi]
TQHRHAIPQAAVTRSTRHIHRHNHRIRITRYMSRNPSHPTQQTRSKHPPQQPHAPVHPHPSMTRQKISSHPALNETRSPTQRSHTRCTTPAGKEIRGAHFTPSTSLLLMATEENSRHTQLPACTTKGAFKPTAMCNLCVCGCCVPAETQSKDVEKREQSMWRDARNVQQRRITETTRRRPLKLMTALQPKQWQFTQDLFKTKKTFPFVLYKPHHTK